MLPNKILSSNHKCQTAFLCKGPESQCVRFCRARGKIEATYEDTCIIIVSCGCVTIYHKLGDFREEKCITVTEDRSPNSVSLGKCQGAGRTSFPRVGGEG